MVKRSLYECPGCGLAIMDRVKVRSSNIVAVGFEADEGGDTGILEIEFKRGVVYQYADVPERIYQELIFSPSPGRYLTQNIIEAFEGQRIE